MADKFTKLENLSGPELALWAARAQGREERERIKLFVSGPCLYREVGQGASPYSFRPDSNQLDGAQLIYEMSQAGVITLFSDGAQFEAPGFGSIGFSDGTATALTRCYIAWKLGRDFGPPAE